MVEASRESDAPDLTPNPAFPTATLMERRQDCEDLMVIKLEVSEKFDFKPGQYCTLGLGKIERAYSIVSAPYEKYLEIFVELVPEGQLTPKMFALKIGEKMSVRPRAKGIFVQDKKAHHHFMISTVTGVALPSAWRANISMTWGMESSKRSRSSTSCTVPAT